jgi:formate dehydrogenase major subunit
MELSRREFLKRGGAATAVVLMHDAVHFDKLFAVNNHGGVMKKEMGEVTTICPYDASGCGFIVATSDGQVNSIEGDPDHPINRGGACSKGAGMAQLRTVDGELNPNRLTHVLYRAPNSTEWETKDWDWAIDQIARKVKGTRDANWTEKDDSGYIVNRTDAIASIGSAALDNEECYPLAKMMRGMGLVYLEHHARI